MAPAPWARACALAGCSTLLAGASHAATGAGAPPLLLAGLGLALVPVVRSWLDREASTLALLSVVASVQLVLHVVLGWSAMTAGPTGSMGGHADMPAPGAGLGTVLPLPSGLMLGAHALAVLLVVAVLRRAEAAVCAAVRCARAAAARLPLAAAVRLAGALPALPAPAPAVALPAPRRPAPQVLLPDVQGRRGPPVPVS